MAGASRRRISDILCLLALFMAHSFFPSHFLRHMYHPNEDGGWVSSRGFGWVGGLEHGGKGGRDSGVSMGTG
eukprot:569989-Amorphochlora_amoeboformis.AAC.1